MWWVMYALGIVIGVLLVYVVRLLWRFFFPQHARYELRRSTHVEDSKPDSEGRQR